MPTDSNECRPIEELIKLDSFQGMTDEEITLLMNYRAAIAAKDAVFSAEMDIQRERMEAQAEAFRSSAQHADELLSSLVNTALPLENVEVVNIES